MLDVGEVYDDDGRGKLRVDNKDRRIRTTNGKNKK
jgi:hypothetical protein